MRPEDTCSLLTARRVAVKTGQRRDGFVAIVDGVHLDLQDEMNHMDDQERLREDLTIREMEQELILRKLSRTGGNRTQAASELGISVRTLRNKLHLYADLGVEIPG